MTARTRIVLIALIVPAILAVAALVVILLVAPELPDPIATHWGPTGVANGFGPLWVTAVLPIIVTAGYSVLVVVVMRDAQQRTTVIHKMLFVTAPFLAAMVSVIGAGSVLIQRGLGSAADAPSVVPVVLAGLVTGVVLAVAGWFVLPEVSPAPESDADLPTLELTSTARATWMQHAGPNRTLAVIVIAILVLAVVLGTAALWLAAPLEALVLYVVLIVAVLVLVVGTLFWRVSVDRRGFRAISLLGWPRFSYPLSQLEFARVVEVNPVGEFGGWGLRWGGNGRFGIVLRAGEAIEVQRTNGKSIVVTVPKARTGAALVNALVASRVTSGEPVE